MHSIETVIRRIWQRYGLFVATVGLPTDLHTREDLHALKNEEKVIQTAQ
jgi:hypothetical protein